MVFPRIIISALRGGSGKTILSIGIIAAWRSTGNTVAPFKKGPDYIDAGWLALAAGRPCYNLDAFLIPEETIVNSFFFHRVGGDIAVIEGNRGLFDGIDVQGRTSTAELAKLLKAPVVLCIDATKTTRTAAAIVSGCLGFDVSVPIKGVILNHVAGTRHEKILRSSIETHCGVPILGAVPKLTAQYFPERHMGLVPTAEHAWAQESIEAAGRLARDYLDLDGLMAVAMEAEPLIPPAGNTMSGGRPSEDSGSRRITKEKHQKVSKYDVQEKAPKIGVIKDAAFQFYYPENLEALVQAGADLVYVSPLKDRFLPQLDALYIGGGFPETHVQALASNKTFRDDLRALVDTGFPVYAECGGLMYLGQTLVVDHTSYPMAGVFPIVYDISKTPQGHGYTIIEVDRQNAYYSIGTEIRGHEFHYSSVLKWGGKDSDLVFRMCRGKGLHNRRDGVCYRNVLATYTHIHALGTPGWAQALVGKARVYQQAKKEGKPCF